MPASSSTVLVLTGSVAVRQVVERAASEARLAPGSVLALDPAVGGDAAVRAAWGHAAAVVVDAARAQQPAGWALPRRPRVTVWAPSPDLAVWQLALALGADRVLDALDSEPELVACLEQADTGSAARAMAVGVLPGTGGAGASTVATALAIASARERSTVLVDADPGGGGLDVLAGAEHVPGPRWSDLAAAGGAGPAGGSGLSGGGDPAGVGAVAAASRAVGGTVAERLLALPVADGVPLLSWGRAPHRDVPARVVVSVLAELRRRHDLVVVDLPRRPDGATVSVAELDEIVLVVPSAVRASAAAAGVAQALGAYPVRVGLVVRQLRGTRLAPADIATALDLPVLGVLRSEGAVTDNAEKGVAPPTKGSLGDCARALLRGWVAA